MPTTALNQPPSPASGGSALAPSGNARYFPPVQPLHARGRLGLLCVLLSFAATHAAATTADDVCNPSADPCIIASDVVADAGSIIDVGERDLIIASGGSIVVQGGALTLVASDVRLTGDSRIRTSGATRADPAGSVRIQAGDMTLIGDIDTRGSPPGDIVLAASRAMEISGRIRGRSEAADSTGANFVASAATIVLSGDVDLSGGREDEGGSAVINANSVTLSGALIASGGDGGSVDITVVDTALVDSGASITTAATTAAGDGSDITIESNDVLEIRGALTASGRDGGEDGGGLGGSITLSGDGRVLLTAGASIESLGGGPDGLGGDIEVTSFFGPVVLDAVLDTSMDERDGMGGSVDVVADGAVEIGGSLRAVGGLGGGGLVSIDSNATMIVGRDASIDASTSRDSEAGDIELDSPEEIIIAGIVRARSSRPNDGRGGTVAVQSCTVEIAPTAEIDTSGPNGANQLTSGGRISVRGTLRSGPEDATNTLAYSLFGPTPSILGAEISPPPIVEALESITPCGTPIFTPSPTASASPTATPIRPPCPGDCDLDRVVRISELIRAVRIALGENAIGDCPAGDGDGDGRIGIGELIQATGAALAGCP